jgi:hypothetical protein
LGGRRPDSPETHPGGGNRLSRRAFLTLWPGSQRAARTLSIWNGDGGDGLSRVPQRREGLAEKDKKMNGLKRLIRAATRKAQGARAVPLVVPHGGADASSDFESAFEMLQGDDRARELWRRDPVRIPFGRVS